MLQNNNSGQDGSLFKCPGGKGGWGGRDSCQWTFTLSFQDVAYCTMIFMKMQPLKILQIICVGINNVQKRWAMIAGRMMVALFGLLKHIPRIHIQIHTEVWKVAKIGKKNCNLNQFISW